MRTEDYFRSISSELQSVKNRVRQMIGDRHWQTDGEWKESVLRSVIRRTAPATVSIGRGFIVTRDSCSSQIDILIHDNSHPVLYRDGDLVFVSPAACKAIIEVKSRLNVTKMRETADKLAVAAEFLRRGRGGSRAFVGLFSYESQALALEPACAALAAAVGQNQYRMIDHVVLDSDKFIKWWHLTPQPPTRDYKFWHAYELTSMSAGYFIHNLLMHLSPEANQYDDAIWFPDESKEVHLVHTQPMQYA